MSCAAPNASIGWPSSNERKASCFSAVSPVCGWNQCVKCVAPCVIAHSLMACATRGATSTSSFLPCFTASTSLAWMSRGSLSRIWRTPKVFVPKYSEVRGLAPLPFGLEVRTSRSVISWMTTLRADEEDAGIEGGLAGVVWRPGSCLRNVPRFVQEMQLSQSVSQEIPTIASHCRSISAEKAHN